ncbi:MAG: HAMP domain-containing histidine kinase [Promicromonosporaceae bacterium]|nr:HAMP domain-containing histidine kinase [Promicromonosporaceae bacterium]
MHSLNRRGALRIKLTALVVMVATFAAALTWLGMRLNFGPTRTFPLVIVASLVLTQIVARGITAPLRQMTAAAQAMAGGDYGQRVQATGRNEVGALAVAFNQMADDLASADQTRRDLIANVSHELRTPIAALRAQLENLVDGVIEPTPAALESTLTQTERLTRLVNYLLDLSRIEAGASALAPSLIEVGDFLEDIAQDLSTVEAAKDLHYLVDITPPDLVLEADPERLRQVIVNLLHNAIRHSPVGGEIRLVAYPASLSGEQVVINVSDDGPGIAPADRERAFERFARVGTAAAGGTGTGGTGIGLSIVRWAVDLHGGTVAFVDSPAGATVRLTLPAKVAASAS